MRSVFKFLGVGLLLSMTAAVGLAQRPRAVDTSQPASDSKASLPPAPQSFKAKYEGGVFGHSKTKMGTLSFDDVNSRLVFRDENNKEFLSMPYSAITGAFADTQKHTPTGAKVMRSLPIPYGGNLAGWFIKRKYQYLALQFDDPDTHVAGSTSFKLENKEILASVVNSVAEKAGLEARGEVFIRKKPAKDPSM
ncbi:MAG: hypothetical protein QOJ64_1409 [Acidobacteriota bacterium]|jgi:hypothetical protein|nr:hypothetical protein [Acidobacteriota bacterium]